MSTVPLEPPTIHEEAAQAMLAQLRALAQSVPGFTHMPVERRRKVIPAASLPDEFLQAVAVACDANAHLANSGQVTGAELRDVISFRRSYISVAEEAELFARGIRDAVNTQGGDAGQRALRAYHHAKRANHPADRELLIPHLAAMKQALNRGQRSKAKSKAAKEAAAKSKAAKEAAAKPD